MAKRLFESDLGGVLNDMAGTSGTQVKFLLHLRFGCVRYREDHFFKEVRLLKIQYRLLQMLEVNRPPKLAGPRHRTVLRQSCGLGLLN
jgi:hypothetical protein